MSTRLFSSTKVDFHFERDRNLSRNCSVRVFETWATLSQNGDARNDEREASERVDHEAKKQTGRRAFACVSSIDTRVADRHETSTATNNIQVPFIFRQGRRMFGRANFSHLSACLLYRRCGHRPVRALCLLFSRLHKRDVLIRPTEATKRSEQQPGRWAGVVSRVQVSRVHRSPVTIVRSKKEKTLYDSFVFLARPFSVMFPSLPSLPPSSPKYKEEEKRK